LRNLEYGFRFGDGGIDGLSEGKIGDRDFEVFGFGSLWRSLGSLERAKFIVVFCEDFSSMVDVHGTVVYMREPEDKW